MMMALFRNDSMTDILKRDRMIRKFWCHGEMTSFAGMISRLEKKTVIINFYRHRVITLFSQGWFDDSLFPNA